MNNCNCNCNFDFNCICHFDDNFNFNSNHNFNFHFNINIICPVCLCCKCFLRSTRSTSLIKRKWCHQFLFLKTNRKKTKCACTNGLMLRAATADERCYYKSKTHQGVPTFFPLNVKTLNGFFLKKTTCMCTRV